MLVTQLLAYEIIFIAVASLFIVERILYDPSAAAEKSLRQLEMQKIAWKIMGEGKKYPKL